MSRLGVGLAALATVTVACGGAVATPSSVLPPGPAGIARWRQARAELAALRAPYQSSEPYTVNVSLRLSQPHLPRALRARGAVAVRPPDALRMVLLGPAGTTALDLWVCRDQYRFAVAAVDLVRRGDSRTAAAERRGLPVDFLRWWFLHPLAGSLLSFVDEPDARRFVLGGGDQVMHVSRRGGDGDRARLDIRRLSAGEAESLIIDGQSCGQVRYRQQSTAIDIAVRCERRQPGPPPDRAFADPDDPSKGCGSLGAGS